MIHVCRLIPRVARCVTKRYLATAQAIIAETDQSEIPSQRSTAVHGGSDTVEQTHRVLAASSEYAIQGPSLQGVHVNYADLSSPQEPYVIKQDEGALDSHVPMYDNGSSRVGLYSCMQSNVPYPVGTSDTISGYSSYLSMPGAGRRLLDKHLSAAVQATHSSRQFATSALSMSQGGQTIPLMDFSDPTPQGIQGDQCVSFKLWLENCVRYGLPNCDEQLYALKSGRKTLAQVFAEQQELITEVAEKYRRGDMKAKPAANGMIMSTISVESPCPQGIQGDECVRYRLWLENCHRFEFGACEETVRDIQSGRKTLSQVFEEQDRLIQEIVHQYQQRRHYSTAHRDDKVGRLPTTEKPKPNIENLSQKDKLKRAVRDYGATVIVFHVGISLVSLGGFYLAVSSGIDVMGLLAKLGIGESVLQTRAVAGAGTFVIAYAVHKVFAPVRIGVTLTCVPFIVRYLRKIGILKPPKSAENKV